MNPSPDLISRAVELHMAGRLVEAVSLYQQALQVHPEVPELYYNLASILPTDSHGEQVFALYQQAIALRPDFAEAYNNLGNWYKERSQLVQAMEAYERALQIAPNFAVAYNNRGSLLQLQGAIEAAEKDYRQAAEWNPQLGEAHFNLGVILTHQERDEEAIDAFRKAIDAAPGMATAHNALGQLLLKRHDIHAALQAFERAVQLKPDYDEAVNHLGIVLFYLGRIIDSVRVFEYLLKLVPNFAKGFNNLGNSYKALQQNAMAEKAFRKAIELDPNYVEAYANLGGCYIDQNRAEDAIVAFRKAVELNPEMYNAVMLLINQLQYVCDWSELEPWTKRIVDVVDRDIPNHLVSPFSFIGLPLETTAEQQWKCGRAWSKNFPAVAQPMYRQIAGEPHHRGDKRLRIGYISADYRAHAVAFMIPELFESHDRREFEVFAYATTGADGSPIRKRLEAAVDHFRVIQPLSHQESAALIASDGIDILVDLQGYTSFARTEILALRPAPIQVSYIGFPGTMGADFIDYILVDDFVVPSSQQPYYSERLVHLPGCYQVNDRQHVVAQRKPTREECGLPAEGIVFCSFNSSYKYNAATFDLWMRLLRSVPHSVLWVAETNAAAKKNLVREAADRGISDDRLLFAPRIPIEDHLARQPLADLFLDSFPYNAHATASIALRMGVPVITRSGQTLSTRVAGSLLRGLGLPELITSSFDEYEALALRLATHPDERAAVRQKLARQLVDSPVFDGRVFAKNVEKAYRRMWEIFADGSPPMPIAVTDEEVGR